MHADGSATHILRIDTFTVQGARGEHFECRDITRTAMNLLNSVSNAARFIFKRGSYHIVICEEQLVPIEAASIGVVLWGTAKGVGKVK